MRQSVWNSVDVVERHVEQLGLHLGAHLLNMRPQRGKILHTHNLPDIKASLRNLLDPRLEVMTWLFIRGAAELTFKPVEAGQGKPLLRKGKMCVNQ